MTDWVSVYQAIINTVALGVAALIYTAWVRQKNAQIDNLQTQIEHWKSQSVTAVHQANEALRKEMEELSIKSNREREQFQREKEELLTTITELKTQREAPSETRWQRLQDIAASRFDKLIAFPPSGQTAESLGRFAEAFKRGVGPVAFLTLPLTPTEENNKKDKD